jgi:hypothetical protein
VRALAAHDVAHVVDIVAADDPDNIARLSRALRELGVGATPGDDGASPGADALDLGGLRLRLGAAQVAMPLDLPAPRAGARG